MNILNWVSQNSSMIILTIIVLGVVTEDIIRAIRQKR